MLSFHSTNTSPAGEVDFSSKSVFALGLSALLLLLWCVLTPAWALAQGKMEHKAFHYFSIDVPHGWYVHKDEEVITFTKPQQGCAITVMILPQMEIEFRELGISFYQNLQGHSPMNDDGGMSFFMKTQYDVPGIVRLASNGNYFSAVTAIGQCEAYENIFESLLILDENGIVVPITMRPYPLLDLKPKAPKPDPKASE